jgi:hypothetical protein
MLFASKPKFFAGIALAILLMSSYIIRLETTESSSITTQPLLAILIFHSPLVLALYAIIILYLIITGIKKIELQ